MTNDSAAPTAEGKSFSHRVGDALANVFAPRGILASTLDVTSLSIPIAGLPAELDGYTLAQVSDLHEGEAKHWTPHWTADAAEVIRAARPDVIVNTGDFVWQNPPARKAVATAAPFVRDSATSAPSIAILGNHDYYLPEGSRLTLAIELSALGIHLLTNAAMEIERAGHAVTFVGITDEEDTYLRGVEALLAAPRPRIALVHVPDLAESLPRGAADLVLSGHTHGGQITFPFLERAIVRRGCGSNYVEGLYTINEMPVYVNRGLGYTGYPIRFRARPEVTLIRLTR